ncbi:hypothetical protein PF008_g29843 [Phytophthora fragariae]|uniref:Uncharacterized protein n=1 Tax=Phytophthora fragariae TaxID=53985 RepID=A0A6G0Q7D1_9STRA|nr:hypothetical protein PF008_g29843 [Phytophthora fragariae]
MSFHVRWNRSTNPNNAGLYGTGVSCFACSTSTSASITLSFNSGAPSMASSRIGPNTNTNFSAMKFATSFAVWFGTAATTEYRVA